MSSAGRNAWAAKSGGSAIQPGSARERLALRREARSRSPALRRRRRADAGLPFAAAATVLQAQRILELERELRVALREMHRDPLTGLLNRRGLSQAFEHVGTHRALARADLCCVYLDLDDFKQINDSFGHATGDACLRHFAQVLLSTLRRQDLVARVGGDEFVILLPQVSGHEAAGLVYRVKEALVRRPAQGHVRLEFCAGLTDVGPDEGLDVVLARADSALLDTKSGPKNRTIFSGSLACATNLKER